MEKCSKISNIAKRSKKRACCAVYLVPYKLLRPHNCSNDRSERVMPLPGMLLDCLSSLIRPENFLRTHSSLPCPKSSCILKSLLLYNLKHSSYRLLSADNSFNLPANRHVGHVTEDGQKSDLSTRCRGRSR